MQGFLQFVGGCTVLVLVAIVVGFLIVRRKFKKLTEDLDDLAFVSTPGILTLEPRAKLDWKDAKAATRVIDDLMLHGFQSDGQFVAAQMPQLLIHGFVNPSRSLFAALYEHPMADLIIDVVQKTTDGRTLTVTTAMPGAELDSMPGKTSVRLSGGDVAQLMAAWEESRLDGDSMPVEPGTFKDSFEKSYREEMAWRAARGGATPDEIQRSAQMSSEDYSPEVQEMALQMQRLQANRQLQEILRQQFLEESGVSATEWDRIQARLTIIHDNLSREELESILSGAEDDWDNESDEDDDMQEPALGFEVPDMPARAAFAAVNATFAPGRQFVTRWECEEPIAADFYTGPMYDGS